MSLATIDLVRPSASRRLVPVEQAAPVIEAPSHIRAVPGGAEARGFVLYVGVDESKAAAAGTDLAHVVAALRALASELVPTSETYAAVALIILGSRFLIPLAFN